MRPLVILHGLFGSSRNWKTISNKLAAELQNDKILSIDLRNHNQFNNVDAPRGPIKSWRTLQDDLEAYWKLNLKGQDFDLLGHSFGGQISMSSVLREDSPLRDAVKKLIIVDVSLRHPSADKSLENDHLYKLMETMNEINGLRIDKRVDVVNELRKVEKDEHVINFLLLNLFRSDDFFKFHSLELNHLMQAWPLLKSEWNEIKTNSFVSWEGEALFLKGDRSDYIRESDYEEMKKFFPNSSVEIIPNSGHWPHFDNQSVFIDNLVKFLKPK